MKHSYPSAFIIPCSIFNIRFQMANNSMLQTLRKPHLINALQLCILKNEHKNKKLMDCSTDFVFFSDAPYSPFLLFVVPRLGLLREFVVRVVSASCGSCTGGFQVFHTDERIAGYLYTNSLNKFQVTSPLRYTCWKVSGRTILCVLPG